jgi:hypothetical protein
MVVNNSWPTDIQSLLSLSALSETETDWWSGCLAPYGAAEDPRKEGGKGSRSSPTGAGK